MKKAATIGGGLLVAGYLVWLLADPLAWSNFREHPIGVTLGVLAIVAYIYFAWKHPGRDPAPPSEDLPPLSNTYGSARYAQRQSTPEDEGRLVHSGVFFGKSHSDEMGGDGPGAPICGRSGNHTLILGRTRTGKGTRVILPTLLANRGQSFFIIDPKGENCAVSARARAVHSHVQIINPWNELGDVYKTLGFTPATYNPLDVLDKHDPNVVSVAENLANAICPSDGMGKDSYWSHSAASLMTAVLLWLTDREGIDIDGKPPERKTLARAREIVSLTREQLLSGYLEKMVGTDAFSGAMREHAAQFIDLAPETYSGVISNLARFTRFISDPRIKAVTGASSFSMLDLTGSGMDRPTTLYLVIPPDKVDVQKTWLKLMIAAGTATFRRKGPDAPYRCTFLIDEFPALGVIEDARRDIATLAGHGIDFVLISQSLAVLKEIYGEAHIDIINNCAYKWFCNVSDLQSAEFLSKMLGNKTVRTTNTSESSGESKSPGGPSTNTGKNTSYGETARALLTPDEAMNLGRDTAILLAPSTRPHYLKPVDYWKLQEAFEDFRQGYPDMFWPLYYDPNPYLPATDQQQSPDPIPKPFDAGLYAPKAGPKPAVPTPIPIPGKTDPAQSPSGHKVDLGLYGPKGTNGIPPEPKPDPESKPYDYGLYAPKKPKG